MTHAAPTAFSADEISRRRRLTRLIWNTDNLTALVQAYSGMAVRPTLRDQRLRPPTDAERASLQMHAATKNLLNREGVTQTAIQAGMAPLVLIAFTSVIDLHRVPEQVRESLLSGIVGLGAAIRPYGGRRHTHEVAVVDGADAHGQQLLRVRATLSLPDTGPVALVDEIVYTSVLR